MQAYDYLALYNPKSISPPSPNLVFLLVLNETFASLTSYCLQTSSFFDAFLDEVSTPPISLPPSSSPLP